MTEHKLIEFTADHEHDGRVHHAGSRVLAHPELHGPALAAGRAREVEAAPAAAAKRPAHPKARPAAKKAAAKPRSRKRAAAKPKT